jgi:hypothetical protein
MIALLEFVELRTGVTIVSELPKLLFDKFKSMGWNYYKLLACSTTIDIEYPPSPLCDTCQAGGGVVRYLGPQLDMELQDTFWGGDRTLFVKLIAGKKLVPEFPHFDMQWDRSVVNANFFNNIANMLKLGGQVAGTVR